jgi:hypothetical protein
MGEDASRAFFDIAVVERGPAALVLADSGTARIVRRFALPPHPRAVAVRPDRRFAYVVHDGPDPETEVGPPGRLITVVDLQTGQVHGQQLEGMARPCDLALDAEGRLHLLIAEAPSLLRGTRPNTGTYEAAQRLPQGRPLRLLPRGGGADAFVLDAGRPDAAARLLVQPFGDGVAAGGLERPVALPVVARPSCMALSPDGRWLAVGGAAGPEITLVDARRLVFYPALAASAPLADLAFDADGGLHVALAGGGVLRGDVRTLAPCAEVRLRAFVRGRPAWGLTGDALVEVEGDGRIAGLEGPAMACAVPADAAV